VTGPQKVFAGVAVLAVAGAAVVALELARGDETLSVQTALSEARGKGFDAVIWRATPTMRQAAERTAASTGREVMRFSGEGQVILVRGRPITDLTQPTMIVWFPSSDAAALRVEADRPVLEGRLSRDELATLPAGFDVRQFSEERVCNLVLTSYDDGSDGSLSARFSDLVEALKRRCS
jgi:hypothetical protein